MKTVDLKNSIEALKSLRAEMHEDLDTGVIDRLDKAILELQDYLEGAGDKVVVPEKVKFNSLEVLGEALRLMTNISEIVRLWIDMS